MPLGTTGFLYRHSCQHRRNQQGHQGQSTLCHHGHLTQSHCRVWNLVAVVCHTAQLVDRIHIVLQMVCLQNIELCQLLCLGEAIDAVRVRVQDLVGANALEERQQRCIGAVGSDGESVGVGDHVAS